jgi:hypothetical protein
MPAVTLSHVQDVRESCHVCDLWLSMRVQAGMGLGTWPEYMGATWKDQLGVQSGTSFFDVSQTADPGPQSETRE